MVVVLIDVGVKGRIKVDVVPLATGSQTVLHSLVGQPLFQFGGGDDVVDNTLSVEQTDLLKQTTGTRATSGPQTPPDQAG